MNPPAFAKSTVIAGRYVLDRELGHGATATVHLARDERTGGEIALKILRPELAESVGAERFLREIRLTAGLKHPSIVSILDSGAEDGVLYCVLPYMNDGTLRDRLTREKQLPISDAIAITRTIADALAYAHARGLIHRDIKPENILFSGGLAYLGDFGIARLLHAAVGESTTTTGVVRGTPAYMSPEQASGERDYDGRSDLYSLGCVLYEMVSGMPPFVGPTSQSVLAQRFTNRPQPMTVYRDSVTPELQAIVTRAMMLSPADRFATADEMSLALDVLRESTPGLPVGSKGRFGHRTAVILLAAVTIALTAIGWAFRDSWTRHSALGAGAPVDTTLLALFPFEHSGDTPGSASVDALLYDAFSSWRGISVVEPFRIRDALARRAGKSIDHLGVAGSLGAGRFVRGEIVPVGPAWRLRAWLRDVRFDSTLARATISISPEAKDNDLAYAPLADSLLLRGATDTLRGAGQPSTKSLPAIQSFALGFDALDEWDLPRADSLFQRATVFDPEYARASLWQAQVRAWQSLDPSTWRTLAERATIKGSRLSPRERMLATALQEMADGQFAGACVIYSGLRARNRLDFTAWYGYGQCLDRDLRVVRDGKSPTGWRYVASYQEAVNAYRRAFELLSLSHRSFQGSAFGRLRKLLYLGPSQLRKAVTMGADSGVRLVGRLDREGDTLVMRPVPLELVMRVEPAGVPAGLTAAIALQQRVFSGIAAAWSAALPASAGAKEAVAISLEMRGDRSAIDTLRVARQLAVLPVDRLRLAVAELISRLKFSGPSDTVEIRAIRRGADSLLSAGSRTSAEEASVLVPVAALVGRCGIMAELLQRSAKDEQLKLPRDVVVQAAILSGKIALGCRMNASLEIASIRRRIAAIEGPSSSRDEYSIVGRAVRLTDPLDSVSIAAFAPTGDYLLQAELALLHADNSGARSWLSRVNSSRAVTGYNDVGPDAILAEAKLSLALGDTTMAAASLDRLLDRIRFSSPDMLNHAETMGAFIRAMAMRADIGAARREREGSEWAEAVSILWANADPGLAQIARRMSNIHPPH
jgi:eukaryotic-like serine/threonine-protein kinase